jgi:hypothetical protein
MSDHPTEQGHYYDPKTGEPRYTYTNAKGETKNTTLRECRKYGWVPSVTQIIKCADRPGLNNWIQEQTILACLTLPKIDGEAEADYIKRLKEDSKAQAKKASERGTQIHAIVQKGFQADFIEREDQSYYISAKRTLDAECGPVDWICEKSFATDRYGGKCDLHNDQFLIDIKSVSKDLANLETYEEHWMQASGYDKGLGEPRWSLYRKCGILFIHQITAESRLIWITDKEIAKGWKMFNALLDFWYARTGL